MKIKPKRTRNTLGEIGDDDTKTSEQTNCVLLNNKSKNKKQVENLQDSMDRKISTIFCVRALWIYREGKVLFIGFHY